MEQIESKINKTIVTRRNCRFLVSKVPQNWIRTNPAIIEEKYRLKSMNFKKFEPVDENRILYRGKLSMGDTFAITEIFNDFDGRIITNESILYNEEQEVNVRVEWDCGATYSSISEELAQRLGLKPCGVEMTTSTTSSELSDIYEIILVLHNEIGVPMKVGTAHNIHNSGIDMLIGMEVISLGDFAISTYDNKTCFSFRYPSKGLIDFTKEC